MGDYVARPQLPSIDGAIMTERLQVFLSHDDERRAVDRASRLGLSVDEYLRRLILHDLAQAERVAALFNLGSSGGSDIARDKDRMVGEAFDSVQ